jgi:hypothetical protein
VTFAELKLELRSRDHTISELRAGRFINDAYQELCDCESWPFLEDAHTGTSPATIADYRKVQTVVDTTHDRRLSFITETDLRSIDPELAQTGAPSAYYLTGGDTINVWPVSTVDLRVDFLKVPTDMSADGDEPLPPARYHGLIVDMAQIRAARFRPEQVAFVPQLIQMVDYEKDKMREALLVPTTEPHFIERVESGPYWYW